jgi:hypothetical protein
MKETNPREQYTKEKYLARRDLFAAAALTGLCANIGAIGADLPSEYSGYEKQMRERIVRTAWLLAEAMLAHRPEPPGD